MTFTYNLATDTGKVRLHINDTSDGTGGQAKLTDEEIAFAISEGDDTYQGGVIVALTFLMAKVADPNFTADWLTVNNASAYASLKDLQRQKRQEFGLPALTASVTHAYRADSNQTSEPTYTTDEDDD